MDEYKKLLKVPLKQLIDQAADIRKRHLADKIDLCSIVNAKSGLCSEDCKFCAQSSKHKCEIQVYPFIGEDKLFLAAKKARQNKAHRIGIVTSGNRLNKKELLSLAKAIERIRAKIGIKVCASLGALKKEQLKTLKKAGLGRFHHNIETSPRFYSKIVSTHSFDERIETIKNAQQAGLEICSGGIIGLGETWQDRLAMASVLKDLNVDSVPINFLIAIKGTPLQNVKPISCKDAIKTIAIFRIILKNRDIKIAAGRESILKDFQGLGFLSGANGMLIGGYLTIAGRDPQQDHKLVREIKNIW